MACRILRESSALILSLDKATNAAHVLLIRHVFGNDFHFEIYPQITPLIRFLFLEMGDRAFFRLDGEPVEVDPFIHPEDPSGCEGQAGPGLVAQFYGLFLAHKMDRDRSFSCGDYSGDGR